MNRPDDLDADIERFRAALAPAPVDPPVASLNALHRAVTQNFHRADGRVHWRTRLAVGGALFTAVVGGSATAFALSGATLPQPLRDAMTAVGLPVDSTAVADAKAAEARLRAALRAKDAEVVERDARTLRGRLARLSPDDRRDIAPRAQVLLQEASRMAGDEASPSEAGNNGSTGTTVAPSATDREESPPTTARAGTGEQPSTTSTTAPSSEGGGETPTTATTPTTAPSQFDGDNSQVTTTIPGTGDGGGTDGSSSGSGG